MNSRFITTNCIVNESNVTLQIYEAEYSIHEEKCNRQGNDLYKAFIIKKKNKSSAIPVLSVSNCDLLIFEVNSIVTDSNRILLTYKENINIYGIDKE